MFVAFTDESGNDDKSQVFAMATILLCHFSSYYFANEWQVLLKCCGLRSFHASAFEGDLKTRKSFEEAAIRLFLKFEVKHSAVLVDNGGYKRAFVETNFYKTLRPAINGWKKTYFQAFQHTISDLREYADDQPKGMYIIPVFDNSKEFIGQAKQDFIKKNQDRKLGNMVVSNTQEYVQLQASDFLAWEYRVNVQRFLETGDRTPGPVLEALKEHTFGARIWTYEMLDYLRRRVEAVNSGIDPETVDPTL